MLFPLYLFPPLQIFLHWYSFKNAIILQPESPTSALCILLVFIWNVTVITNKQHFQTWEAKISPDQGLLSLNIYRLCLRGLVTKLQWNLETFHPSAIRPSALKEMFKWASHSFFYVNSLLIWHTEKCGRGKNGNSSCFPKYKILFQNSFKGSLFIFSPHPTPEGLLWLWEPFWKSENCFAKHWEGVLPSTYRACDQPSQKQSKHRILWPTGFLLVSRHIVIRVKKKKSSLEGYFQFKR